MPSIHFIGEPVAHPKSCILVVEDNTDDAAIAVRALRDHADTHEVVVVSDGADARDFLERTATSGSR